MAGFGVLGNREERCLPCLNPSDWKRLSGFQASGGQECSGHGPQRTRMFACTLREGLAVSHFVGR